MGLSTGSIVVHGDIAGRIEVAGDMSGDISAVGSVVGTIEFAGTYSGDICAGNLSPGEDSASLEAKGIIIDTAGLTMTVCGVSPGCSVAAPAAAEDTVTSCTQDSDCSDGKHCTGTDTGGRFCTNPKNRFLSFSNPNGGEDTAIRVTPISLYNPDPPPSPRDFSCFEGEQGIRWVGPPEAQDGVSSAHPNLIFAKLREPGPAAEGKGPYYRDWSASALAADFPDADTSVIHVYGVEVMPDSTYEIQIIKTVDGGGSEACVTSVEGNYSAPLLIRTARWGDVRDPFHGAAYPGEPGFIDIGKVVDAFKGASTAPNKDQAVLKGNSARVGWHVGFIDIGLAVGGFKSRQYPYQGPGSCN